MTSTEVEVADGHEEARALVDAVLDLNAGVQRGTGSFSSNFHIRADGHRVINYSEWATAEDHQRVVDTHLQADGAVLSLIRSLPGVRPRGFKRYVPYRGLSRR